MVIPRMRNRNDATRIREHQDIHQEKWRCFIYRTATMTNPEQ
jgi:hypothetical protein